MIVPNPLTIEEVALILVLSLPIILWGFRNGLDAIIIAVLGTLAGMAFADSLAGAVTSAVNTFWKMGNAIITAGFGPDLFAKLREVPGLIETPEQTKLLGTIIFLMIAYVSFKIAVKRAGGRNSLFEGIFGALGGAVTGYLIVTYILPRHIQLPQQVDIIPTQLPGLTLDANVVVLLALVLVVFGVQSSRRGGKK